MGDQCDALKLNSLTEVCKCVCVDTQDNDLTTENEYYGKCNSISSYLG